MATKVLFCATLLSAFISAVFWKTTKAKDWMIIGATLIFSGLTLYFNNENFIKWRPTVINFVLAIGLFVLYFLKKKPFKHLFSVLELNLPDKTWLLVNVIWASYLLLSAAINALLVLLEVSDDLWMNYKTFVNPILTFIFMIGLFGYLYKKSKTIEAVDESDKN